MAELDNLSFGRGSIKMIGISLSLEVVLRIVEELLDSLRQDDRFMIAIGELDGLMGTAEVGLLSASNAWEDVDNILVDTLNSGDLNRSEADIDEVLCTGIMVGTCGEGGPSMVLVTVSNGPGGVRFAGLLGRFFDPGVRRAVTSSAFLGDS